MSTYQTKKYPEFVLFNFSNASNTSMDIRFCKFVIFDIVRQLRSGMAPFGFTETLVPLLWFQQALIESRKGKAMRIETAGKWEDRDVFQLRSRDFYIDNGLVGVTMLAANALSETSSAYLAPVNVLEMHASGYPLCENRAIDSQNPPPVLLPDRAALKEWCIYAAQYRSEAYERFWEKGGGNSHRSGAVASFLLGNKRRLLHCDYFCTYLDEIGIGVVFEPCAYDGKHFFTGNYTYGLATVLQQWKREEGKTHIIVHRSDCNAIDNVVDKVYSWYDGGEASRMPESLWHEGSENQL